MLELFLDYQVRVFKTGELDNPKTARGFLKTAGWGWGWG